MHSECDGAPTKYVDFLHDRDDDPRPALAERLITALGREGTDCAYSGYKHQALRSLGGRCPGRAKAKAQRAMEARFFDLLPVE